MFLHQVSALKSLRILCFTVMLLSLGSCNKDDVFNNNDTIESSNHEGPQGFISFETLLRNIGDSRAFKDNLNYMNINREGYQSRGESGFIDAYIDTSTIHLIEADGMNYYTLKIINNNPNEKANTFYNLNFEQNLTNGEVTSSILQYNPAINWLFDKSKPFKGDIIKFDNELITLEDLINGAYIENGDRTAPCTFASTSWGWTCPNGHTGPGPYGNGTKVCGGNWVITVTNIPCDPGGGNGGGGNGGGSGSTQTVVLEICDGYSNTGGPGNSEDCEVDYAAFFTPYICEEYVDFELINSINNWAPGNMETATALATYLKTHYPKNYEDICVEVDFEDQIILDPSLTTCVKDITTDLKDKSTMLALIPELPININLSSIILNLFSNSSNHNFILKMEALPPNINAHTLPFATGNNTFSYTTTLNNSFVKNATDLAIARTIIHESLHAYLSYMYQDFPFSSLSTILRHHLSNNGLNSNAAQHQFMVEFVDAMAYSLQTWDNNSLNGIDYYKYLSWSGDMLSTPDFNQMPSSFQNNVINANIAEGQAGSGNASTPNAKGSNNCQ